MFSRSKTSPAPPAASRTPGPSGGGTAGDGRSSRDGGPAAKGRPTPKRKVAQAANKRPLVPGDRKAAAQDAKARQREARERQYLALQTGDERYLPARDKGPARRFIRDYVDARWNLGEFFLPIAIAVIVVQLLFTQQPVISLFLVSGLYLAVLATIFDGFVMWRKVRKRLIAKFGDVPKGSVMYAQMRAFQIRRTRLPRPMHKKHGVYPE